MYKYTGWLQGKNAAKQLEMIFKALKIETYSLETIVVGRWFNKTERTTFGVTLSKYELKVLTRAIWELQFVGYHTSVGLYDFAV